MKDRCLNIPFLRPIVLLFAAASVLPLAGCQQTGGSGERTSFLPRIFGGQGVARQQSYLGNSRFANPFNSQSGNQQYAGLANEIQSMNQRMGAYDSDNQLLNTEIAALKQKLQLASQYNQTLKTQLADTSGRMQQIELEKQSAMQQLAGLQTQNNGFGNVAQNQNWQRQNSGNNPNQLVGFGNGNVPSQFAGGATIRANNSLMQRFSSINIPGGQARMDGDVIRIEIPTDRLFMTGTYRVQPSQQPVLQTIVTTIRQNFPRQIVGIEAHWDNTPLNPPTTTHHQLTATQALSVLDQLVQLGLPRNQLFMMAMASNRPRHPQGLAGGISPNRRIELVIYPETYDGSY